MNVFVTGASGFVGSEVVRDLLKAGHRVLGLARSDSAVLSLQNAGADVHRGDIYDLESLKQGASKADAVIHTAFNHDFSKFKENCETDRRVIQALGSALVGTEKPLVVTSGIGLLRADRPIAETDLPPGSNVIPRAATEEAARAVAEQGVDTYLVRLPPTTHGKGDHGFVSMIANIAKENGESAYIGQGLNHWPAVHRSDAAAVYRLAIEKRPGQKVFHAVAETGVPFNLIAEEIGKGLKISTVSKSGADAEKHFKWFLHFASMDCTASSEQTQKVLGWKATAIDLIKDMRENYF